MEGLSVEDVLEWKCQMAWEVREEVVSVDHHHVVEDHFIQKIAAMSVVNVGIMLEIAIVTEVAVGEGAGPTHDPARGPVLVHGIVAPGHEVVHAAVHVRALQETDLQKTGPLGTGPEIVIGHQRTDQDQGTEVPRIDLARGIVGVHARLQTALKAAPVPGLGQGAGVAIPRTGMATPRMMLATSETSTPLFCECALQQVSSLLLPFLCQFPLMFQVLGCLVFLLWNQILLKYNTSDLCSVSLTHHS